MAFSDDMTEICGLWLSKSGKTWTGQLDTSKIPGEGILRIVLMPVDKKGNSKRPDFRLFVGAMRRTAPGQFAADKAIDQARSKLYDKGSADDDLF